MRGILYHTYYYITTTAKVKCKIRIKSKHKNTNLWRAKRKIHNITTLTRIYTKTSAHDTSRRTLEHNK